MVGKTRGEGEPFLADRGYDSEDNYILVKDHGFVPVIKLRKRKPKGFAQREMAESFESHKEGGIKPKDLYTLKIITKTMKMTERGITTVAAVIVTAVVVGAVVGGGVYFAKPEAKPIEEVGTPGHHSDIKMYQLGIGSAEDPVWVTFGKGGETAAKELGIDYTMLYAGSDLPKMLEQLETVIAAEPDAIIFSYQDPDLYDEALQRAKDKGITVIGWCCDDPSEPKVREAFVGNPNMNFLVGLNEAHLSQRIGPDGEPYVKEGAELLFVSSCPGTSWSQGTWDGITGTLEEEYGLVLDEDYTMDVLDTSSDPTEIESRERAYLIAHPDIDAVFSGGCISAEGMIRSMEALNMEPGEIPCFMWVCGPDAIRGIEKGYSPEGGVSVPSPAYAGYMSVMVAFLKLGYDVTPSDLSTFSLIVDKTNVATFKEGMERNFF